MDCNGCIHEKICELWRRQECQDASCYIGLLDRETCKETLQDVLGVEYDIDRLTDIAKREEVQRVICETLRKMVKMYQEEIVPGLRELIYNREPIDRTPLLKCGDLVEINPESRKNKWKKGVVSQVLLCKGDEWVYNITVRRGYPETKNFSCKDEDIGDWVKPVR